MNKQVLETINNEGIATSFDTNNSEGRIKMINAKGTGARSLNELKSEEVITVTDVMLYSDIVDNYGTEQETIITSLFTENDVYGSISSTVKEVASELIPLLKDLEQVDVKVTRTKSKKGQEYLSLVILG